MFRISWRKSLIGSATPADKKSILSEETLDKAQDFVTKYKQNFKNLETFLLFFTQFVLH